MELPKRKSTRLKDYDYNNNGSYFVTLCTKERKKILSEITNNVGDGVLDVPKIKLSKYGIIADKYIHSINDIYKVVHIDKYVIMPNHIHMIIKIAYKQENIKTYQNGSSRTPTPTNHIIPRLVSTFKRFCNKEYGYNIWQRSFHDHIIRNEKDYLKIWKYIDTNPYKWEDDCFYTEGN